MARLSATARIAELEATNASLAQERDSAVRQRDALASELASTHERAVEAERERDLLRAAHERLRQELELLKRRLVVAKAERVDTAQLELEFARPLLGRTDPRDRRLVGHRLHLFQGV